ncbi:MAG: ribosome-associated translation inhibitor RaiA [Isosphaeraceae bacterium]|nr:ribosome-associated translation inhibitor RaiA [Isosphaeraceae bacterium]
MQIEIFTRHGDLTVDQRQHVSEKAEKLKKYFDRLMSIEVMIEHVKHAWKVEVLVSAEHKHDFVATEEAETLGAAVDLCVHKIEHQLRRYKDKIQHHKGDPSMGDLETSRSPEA